MVYRRLTARGILGGAIVGALVVSALVVVPGATASAAPPAPLRHLASGPLPAVTPIPAHAGSHGYPYDAVPAKPSFAGAPTINLAHFGYVEREFTMSGTTNIYRQSGFWGSNGVWNVSVAQGNVPYTTRLLVRYPTNPAKFNGTVVVEWLNDTTGGDQDPVWSEIYHEVLSQGYAYVGVSAQTGSMVEDKTWDPQRYGALGDTNDGQSYDIFSQAAQVARADTAQLLGGLHPTTVIGSGDSQSAFRVATYYNAIQPLSHAFDGFLAVGRGALGAPIGAGLSRSRRSPPSSAPTARRRSSRSRPRATSRSWDSGSPGSPTTPTSAPGSWPGPHTSTCTRGSTRAQRSPARCRASRRRTACSACPSTGARCPTTWVSSSSRTRR